MRLERILVLDGDGQIQYIGEDMLCKPETAGTCGLSSGKAGTV